MPRAKPKTPAASAPAAIASADSIPQVRIRPPMGYTAIPNTDLSLFCGHGMVGSSQVLVPYVDMKLMEVTEIDAEGNESDHKEGWRGTVAYENVAYVVLDIVRDFRAVTRRLRQFSSGPLQPEPERLKYAASCLNNTKTLVQSALDELEALIAEIDRPVSETPANTPTRSAAAEKRPLTRTPSRPKD